MKNPNQIKKNLLSNKSIKNPIIFKEYSSATETSEFNKEAEYTCLKNTIREIHAKNPDHNILILARNNKYINYIFNDEDFIDDLDTKITFKEFRDLEIDGMTIHKSKGLTADETIVIGLNNHFPSIDYQNFWMKDLLKYKQVEENIPFAEERRLFYVALTRTKNYVYLLKNNNPKYRSPFVDEIYEISNEENI